jgi:DNA-binding winged helix-turn-helix (wHTH) protein
MPMNAFMPFPSRYDQADGLGGVRRRCLSNMFGNALAFGRVIFDRRTGELRGPSGAVRLEPKAAAVLVVLGDADGELVSRGQLLDRCWGQGAGSDEALTQAIAQIRRAFEDLGAPQPVETLAKRGYRLRVEAEAVPAPAPANTRSTARVMTLTVGVALLAAVLLAPHGIRHSVRHALGLGPSQAESAH